MILLRRLTSQSSRSLAVTLEYARCGGGRAERGGSPEDDCRSFARFALRSRTGGAVPAHLPAPKMRSAPPAPLRRWPGFALRYNSLEDKTMPRVLSRTLAATFLAVLVGSAVPAQAQQVLRVSAIPDESPTELLRKFSPLGRYLERELGMKVDWTPVNDYPAVVEALAAKKIDLAWFGGVTFVQARMRTGNAIPIVQREEDARFTSKIIVSTAAGINGLADLKGKNFAFGSPSSTSGHLMPRHYLKQNGIDAAKDFKRIAFSGAHDATAAWVESGRVEAGALNASVWDKLVEQNKVDLSKVKVLYTTPPYFDYNWTVRGDLDPAIVRRLTDAFLKLDRANPEHREILELQRASRFIATSAENYNSIEAVGREAGIIK